MAVLVEGISVVTRRAAIERSMDGGWPAFLRLIPHNAFCYDTDLAQVTFMSPQDVQHFVEQLAAAGLTFEEGGKPVDFTVVDQLEGPTLPTEWLEFARLNADGGGGLMSACWLFEGPRLGAGLHLRGRSIDVATPDGWVFEGSLSQDFNFVPTGQVKDELKFLRHEDGIDVYLDLKTGKEVFVRRPFR